MALDRSQEVADTRDGQQHGRRDEAGGAVDDAEPLDEGHDAVGGGAHPVGRDLADGVVERRRGRADAQEEGDLDEEDYEGGYAVGGDVRMMYLRLGE